MLSAGIATASGGNYGLGFWLVLLVCVVVRGLFYWRRDERGNLMANIVI